MKSTILISLLFLTAAQAQDFRPSLSPSKPIRIEYSSAAWNKNANQVETSAVLFRDADTGKIAKIEMTETGDNTGEFVGQNVIGFTNKNMTPEIYIAPPAMMNSTEQMKSISKLIQDGTLLRKPLFFRGEGKVQFLSVFDSRQQAVEAFDQYRKNTMGQSSVDRAAFEAQQKAEAEKEAKRLMDEAAKQEAERRRMAEQERLKQEELKRAQERLSAEEKAARKRQAERLALEGVALFKKDDFKNAEAKFAKSVEMDPDNLKYYYQYGVTLYRNEKYNKSIVILKAANDTSTNPAERGYYLGLNYNKIQDNEQARKEFEKVKAMDDKTFSWYAAFYIGIIDFQKEEYDSAKANFEFVLDNSTDAKMDQQAEAYIEQIANIKAFQENAKKRFLFNITMGMMLDSNILNVADTNVPASGKDGYRGMYSGSLEYRPVYSYTHEFSAKLSMSDMYSMDKGMKAVTDYQNSDPLVTNFSLPYKYKGKAFEVPYQFGLNAAYETINMNQDGSGGREVIMTSMIVKNDNTFVVSNDHFATYSLEYRNDTSKLDTSSSPADDQSATKITLSTIQTKFQNPKKTKAVIIEGGVALNNAKGDNQAYNRYDLAASYMMPWVWDISLVPRLGVYMSDYAKHTTGRKDTDYSLSVNLTKPITPTLAGVISASYADHNSTQESSKYNKYFVLTALSWNPSF